MSSLRATVEKVRAEKAGVEEQLAEVQNLLVREQEAHRGLQEVKNTSSPSSFSNYHHDCIMMFRMTRTTARSLDGNGKSGPENVKPLLISYRLAGVKFTPSNCQHIVNMSALGTRFSWL